MDALEMFLRDHAIVHSARVAEAEGQFSLEDGRLRGLSDEQIRHRPDGWNSLAWLLWHGTIVQRAVAQGAFGPNAARLAGFWEDKSRGWFLYWLAVGHNYMHLGQAGWVREMVSTS